MIKKYISLITVIILLSITLTGCYDSTGIEDFYYIVAIGIDEAENNLVSLSVQTAQTSGSSESSSSQSSEYKIYTVECESIESGIKILNNYLNKKINLSHCSAIIFAENIAKQGLRSYINVLSNDTEIRPDCNIIISSNKAIDVLNKVSNSGEGFSSRLYEYVLNSVDYTGYTIDSEFSEFFSKINSNQTQASAIYCIVNEDSIQNAGAAVFKNDLMVGVISPSQTIAHLLLDNSLDSCMINIDDPFNNNQIIDLNLKIIKKPSINVELINNTPYITIDLCTQANIDSSGESFDYTILENIEKVESEANKYLENLIKEYCYTISKKYNSDILGFGGYLSSKFMTKEELDKAHFQEIFKDSLFEVNVSTSITTSHLFNKE